MAKLGFCYCLGSIVSYVLTAGTLMFSSYRYIFFCLLITIRNFVDSGIKNWMPVIIMETYGATPSFSTFLSVGLLVTNILGVMVCMYIYGKTRYNELLALQIIYIIVMPMMLVLLGFENMNMYITTVVMSIVILFVYGSDMEKV